MAERPMVSVQAQSYCCAGNCSQQINKCTILRSSKYYDWGNIEDQAELEMPIVIGGGTLEVC